MQLSSLKIQLVNIAGKLLQYSGGRNMLLEIPMDSKEFVYFGTKIETTATFRPVFYRPWSHNEAVCGLHSSVYRRNYLSD